MWIWQRLKIKRMLVVCKKQYKPHTLNRLQVYSLLNILDASYFNKYSPMVGQSIFIKVMYGNIESYIKRIAIINANLKNGKAIVSEYSGVDIKTSLDMFFTADGNYLDVPQCVAEFKKQAIDLCILMEVTDNAEVGIHEHNRRALISLFNDINTIVNSLIKVILI